jgi:hypothetical protein
MVARRRLASEGQCRLFSQKHTLFCAAPQVLDDNATCLDFFRTSFPNSATFSREVRPQ